MEDVGDNLAVWERDCGCEAASIDVIFFFLSFGSEQFQDGDLVETLLNYEETTIRRKMESSFQIGFRGRADAGNSTRTSMYQIVHTGRQVGIYMK